MDSTIISALSSTKNKEKQRDPDAHSTKKGTTWYFGYKAHVGVDKDSGLLHSVEVIPGNTADVTMISELLHRKEKTVHGDSGYIGAEKRKEAVVKNEDGKKIRYLINRKSSQYESKPNGSKAQIKRREHEKSSVKAKVEHVLAVLKG